jgi:hypothetical protein
MAARGANVCRVHGGSAPQVKAAAQRRLQQAADVLVMRLLNFALDGDVDDAVALRAMLGALDRAGFSVQHAVEIGGTVELRPWESVLQSFADIEPISREESRRRRGIEPPPALAEPLELAASPAELEIVDAEIVDERDEPRSSFNGDERTARRDSPVTPKRATRRSVPDDDDLGPGYLSMEEAAVKAHKSNLKAGVYPQQPNSRMHR